MKEKYNPQNVGYALLRVAVGVNLMGHGIVRLSKLSGFRNWMLEMFSDSLLPTWVVYAWSSVLPWLELTTGTLLFLGVMTYRASVVGGAMLTILILGSCLIEQWEWVGLQMIYILCFYLLISRVENNMCAIDRWLGGKKV